MPEEFEAFGVPFEERFARFEECIALLEALWTQDDRVTFEGRFWQLRDAPVHLRPVQRAAPAALDRRDAAGRACGARPGSATAG